MANSSKITSAKFENGRIYVKFAGTSVFSTADKETLKYLLKSERNQKSLFTNQGLSEILDALSNQKNYKQTVKKMQSTTFPVNVGNVKGSVTLKTPAVIENTVSINTENAITQPESKSEPKKNNVKKQSQNTKKQTIDFQSLYKMSNEQMKDLDELQKKLKKYKHKLVKLNESLEFRLGVAKKEKQQFSKFTIKELRQNLGKLNDKINQKNKISDVKIKKSIDKKDLQEQIKWQQLVKNEDRLNNLFNSIPKIYEDLLEFYSELPSAQNILKSTNGKDYESVKISNSVTRDDLFTPQGVLKSNKEIMSVLEDIRALFEKQNAMIDQEEFSKLANMEVTGENGEIDKDKMKEYSKEIAGDIWKIRHRESQKWYKKVQAWKKNHPEELQEYVTKHKLTAEYYRKMNDLSLFENADYSALSDEEKDKKAQTTANREINRWVREHLQEVERRGLNKTGNETYLQDIMQEAGRTIHTKAERRASAEAEYKKEVEEAKRLLKRRVFASMSKFMSDNKKTVKPFNIKFDSRKVSKAISAASLMKKSQSKIKIKPLGVTEVRGIENIFIPEESVQVVIYNKNNPMITRVVPESVANNLDPEWSIKTYPDGKIMQFKNQFKNFRRARLKGMNISEDEIKNGIINNKYGCVIAATFFQILVSNTPIDEEYDYTEEIHTVRTRGKGIYTESTDLLGHKTKIIKDQELIDLDLETYDYVYTAKRHHVPDSDSVRMDWCLRYKGRKFTAKEIDSKCPGCFDIKCDGPSIQRIADYLDSVTKDLPLTNVNFTYDNPNKRWEQLEYGGYKSKNSGPNIGSKYGFEHGVKNNFTWQAPKGYLRLSEALWNSLCDSDFIYKNIADFLNRVVIPLDVSKVESELVKNLRNYDSTIDSNQYDFDQIYQED